MQTDLQLLNVGMLSRSVVTTSTLIVSALDRSYEPQRRAEFMPTQQLG